MPADSRVPADSARCSPPPRASTEAAVSVPLGCRRSLGRLDRRRASQRSAPASGYRGGGRRPCPAPEPEPSAPCSGTLDVSWALPSVPERGVGKAAVVRSCCFGVGSTRGSQRFPRAKGSSAPEGSKVAAQRQTGPRNAHARKAGRQLPTRESADGPRATAHAAGRNLQANTFTAPGQGATRGPSFHRKYFSREEAVKDHAPQYPTGKTREAPPGRPPTFQNFALTGASRAVVGRDSACPASPGERGARLAAAPRGVGPACPRRRLPSEAPGSSATPAPPATCPQPRPLTGL